MSVGKCESEALCQAS